MSERPKIRKIIIAKVIIWSELGKGGFKLSESGSRKDRKIIIARAIISANMEKEGLIYGR